MALTDRHLYSAGQAQRREEAREKLAEGIDRGQAKRDDKHTKAIEVAHTFEKRARQWLEKTAGDRAAST